MMPEWLVTTFEILGAISAICGIFATLWAVFRLLAPLTSLRETIALLEQRTRASSVASRRAVKEAGAARKATVTIVAHIAEIDNKVTQANDALAEIQARSHHRRRADPIMSTQ